MPETEYTIRLEDYRAKGAKVFTGRDRGAQVRKDSKLDEIEPKSDKVNFIIPDNVYSINPSFFEELFENVVTKLGKDGFYAKFNFVSEGEYHFEKSLNEAIDRLLRKKTALD